MTCSLPPLPWCLDIVTVNTDGHLDTSHKCAKKSPVAKTQDDLLLYRSPWPIIRPLLSFAVQTVIPDYCTRQSQYCNNRPSSPRFVPLALFHLRGKFNVYGSSRDLWTPPHLLIPINQPPSPLPTLFRAFRSAWTLFRSSPEAN